MDVKKPIIYEAQLKKIKNRGCIVPDEKRAIEILHRKDKKDVASNLFHTTDQNISSWLLCLTYLRNYCAHYSRLYYFLFPAIPATPLEFPYTLGKRLFDYILILKFLCKNKSEWQNSFLVNLQSLIEEYRDVINLKHIGFPSNWLDLLKM